MMTTVGHAVKRRRSFARQAAAIMAAWIPIPPLSNYAFPKARSGR
nr:MAG TPA: hypothetical protein [Bacteriophage sp.]